MNSRKSKNLKISTTVSGQSSSKSKTTETETSPKEHKQGIINQNQMSSITLSTWEQSKSTYQSACTLSNRFLLLALGPRSTIVYPNFRIQLITSLAWKSFRARTFTAGKRQQATTSQRTNFLKSQFIPRSILVRKRHWGCFRFRLQEGKPLEWITSQGHLCLLKVV